MQYNFKNTHINQRFKERFGREFTARDRRNLIQLVSAGEAKIFTDRSDKEKYCILCNYEGKSSIFISPVKKSQRSSVAAMNWRNFIQIEKQYKKEIVTI